MSKSKIVPITKKNKGFIKVSGKKLILLLIVLLIFFALLIVRIGYIQFVQGAWLKEREYKQSTSNTVISAKRGTIYDANGKALAISAQVDTVSINPGKVKYMDNTSVPAEKLATILSTIFEFNLI